MFQALKLFADAKLVPKLSSTQKRSYGRSCQRRRSTFEDHWVRRRLGVLNISALLFGRRSETLKALTVLAVLLRSFVSEPFCLAHAQCERTYFTVSDRRKRHSRCRWLGSDEVDRCRRVFAVAQRDAARQDSTAVGRTYESSMRLRETYARRGAARLARRRFREEASCELVGTVLSDAESVRVSVCDSSRLVSTRRRLTPTLLGLSKAETSARIQCYSRLSNCHSKSECGMHEVGHSRFFGDYCPGRELHFLSKSRGSYSF
ncbi:unnamed protein product [Soboliphyme baturini]|uniref:Secreted protein n=1 Tax=Soboliphyme baturini TaxID=241478 RepID=A0A183ILE1_9BILA|nr:unnamed protein product [Soboliphyme baturini]